MEDLKTTTVRVSRPGFADYELNYHNQSVEDFHRLQKTMGAALFALGDEYGEEGEAPVKKKGT